jgi:hypothetical protein
LLLFIREHWCEFVAKLFVVHVPRGFALLVASAVSGSSGQGCRGYRPRNSFRTSKYELRQNPARSRVTCTGRCAGDSSCSVSDTRPSISIGVLVQPNTSCSFTANTGAVGSL